MSGCSKSTSMSCYAPDCKIRYGTTIWSPLASGILSGKYNSGEIPQGTRLDKDEKVKDFVWPLFFGNEEKTERTLKVLRGLEKVAKDEGITQAQLAIAWTLANQDVSTCLLGASKIQQLEEVSEVGEAAVTQNRT